MTEQPETIETDAGTNVDAERLARIFACRVAVAKAQAAVDDAKEVKKGADATLSRALSCLLDEIDDDPAQMTFKLKGSSEAWKDESLRELGLPLGLQVKLLAEDIDTLGSLSSHMATNMVRDIDGIGDGALEKIANAFDAYWKAHPEYCEDVSN